MLRAAGAEDVERKEEMAAPGLAIHEVGTARMGNDPRTSFVNRWQQSHDVAIQQRLWAVSEELTDVHFPV